MGNGITAIGVFLASPGDTKSERETVAQVINDINRHHGRKEGYRLDLLMWEEDTYPDIGEDAQDVVNRQIGQYQIFIGLMGLRLGSPTKRASSGTVEEFERALDDRLAGDLPTTIMFYFRDPVVRLSEIDLLEALRVQRFKGRVQKLGQLYSTYEAPEDLRRKVEHHLLAAIRDLIGGKAPLASNISDIEEFAGHEVVRLEDWHALTLRLYPQWASFRDIPLENYGYTSFSLDGKLYSDSGYFRFGFKLLTPSGRPFGDASIQSQDNNLLLHIGKNFESPELFVTSYYNGVREALDARILDYGKPRDINVGFSVDRSNILTLSIAGKEAYKRHINPAISKRLMVLAWGDEHEYDVWYRDILLTLT